MRSQLCKRCAASIRRTISSGSPFDFLPHYQADSKTSTIVTIRLKYSRAYLALAGFDTALAKQIDDGTVASDVSPARIPQFTDQTGRCRRAADGIDGETHWHTLGRRADRSLLQVRKRTGQVGAMV